MNLRDYFGKDVRRAQNATSTRRIISYAPITILIVLSLVFTASLDAWVWLALVFLALVVDVILGNRWANKDALERAEASAT